MFDSDEIPNEVKNSKVEVVEIQFIREYNGQYSAFQHLSEVKHWLSVEDEKKTHWKKLVKQEKPRSLLFQAPHSLADTKANMASNPHYNYSDNEKEFLKCIKKYDKLLK